MSASGRGAALKCRALNMQQALEGTLAVVWKVRPAFCSFLSPLFVPASVERERDGTEPQPRSPLSCGGTNNPSPAIFLQDFPHTFCSLSESQQVGSRMQHSFFFSPLFCCC
jgi:hypothetical protein